MKKLVTWTEEKNVKQVLILECDSFAKDKNDLDKIDRLELELSLSDNTPVKTPYRST